MKTKKIIQEIQKLSLQERIYVLERSIHLIRKQEEAEELKKAASELYEDYLSEPELTSFTSLDFEQFYEAR